jgi:hypothetical protein
MRRVPVLPTLQVNPKVFTFLLWENPPAPVSGRHVNARRREEWLRKSFKKAFKAILKGLLFPGCPAIAARDAFARIKERL